MAPKNKKNRNQQRRENKHKMNKITNKKNDKKIVNTEKNIKNEKIKKPKVESFSKIKEEFANAIVKVKKQSADLFSKIKKSHENLVAKWKEKKNFAIQAKVKAFFEKAKASGFNKKVVLAMSFSVLMIVVGTIAIFDYISENKVQGGDLIAGKELTASIVAQNNPLIVAATSITENSSLGDIEITLNSAELQINSLGKLALNPAVTALVAVKDDENEPKEGDFETVSLSPSMKNIQRDLNEIQLFDSKRDVYEMIIDGKVVATFDNPDDPRKTVDAIVNRSVDSSAELLDLEYKQDFEINKTKKSFLSLDESPAVDDVVNYLLTGTKEKHQYTVVAGDIPESIAESNGMTIDELEAANPQIIGRGHLLQIGQVLDLEVPVPMLTVVTTERKEYNDSIDFETTKEENADLYEGETRVKVVGVKGKRQVIAQVKKENGIEVSREIVSEEIVSEPVGEILIIGTKPAPPKKGTGTFMVPLSRGYHISSPYGWRWGRLHKGIDMACPAGNPIVASDGGVVVHAGWKGSYGYMVRIDHGGNLQTTYAHCSALFVNEGDKVFKGQHIANVGSTGRSTGAHVHFEVIKNGVQVDPAPYIYN